MAELQTGQGRMPSPIAQPSAPAAMAPTAQPTSQPTSRPPASGSMAPDPATAAPTLPLPTQTPPPVAPPAPSAPPLPPLALPTATTRTNEERWRAQQQNRVVFEGLRPYFSTGSELWWYDPVNQQAVIIGILTGDFVAQAEFQPLGQGLQALEVPYQVNVSYGLTALSPAILGRIAAAGYESDWIETYVFLSPDVTPR